MAAELLMRGAMFSGVMTPAKSTGGSVAPAGRFIELRMLWRSVRRIGLAAAAAAAAVSLAAEAGAGGVAAAAPDAAVPGAVAAADEEVVVVVVVVVDEDVAEAAVAVEVAAAAPDRELAADVGADPLSEAPVDGRDEDELPSSPGSPPKDKPPEARSCMSCCCDMLPRSDCRSAPTRESPRPSRSPRLPMLAPPREPGAGGLLSRVLTLVLNSSSLSDLGSCIQKKNFLLEALNLRT